MVDPVRILILEDRPADAELIQFELSEAGLDFTARVVTDEKEFVRELLESPPDLVLSDYDLPTYNGALALAEVKRTCPEIPFILVTGAVTEDRAIEILTQGAKDYVLKTRLQQRLMTAVQRALAEAEEHKQRQKAVEELLEARRTLEERVRNRTAELESEIAERKLADEALQSSEKRYRRLFESAKDGIMIIDADSGKALDVNPCLLQLLGYSQADFCGKHLWEIRPFRNLVASGEAFKPFPENEVIRHDSVPLETIDGRFLIVDMVCNAYFVDHHRVIQCSIRDITERKQTEEALRENQALLQSVMDSTTDPVYVKDRESRILMGNEALAKVTGKSLAEIIGRTDGEYYGDEAVGQMLREHDLAVMASGTSETTEETVPTPRGGRVFLSNKAPYRNAFGKIIGTLGISRDITERKRAEEFMLQAKKLSEALNRINESLHSTLNPDEVAQSLVDEAAAALGCDTAAISMREGNGWRVSHVHGMPADVVGLRMTDDQELHALRAFDSCHPVAVPDAFNDDRFNRQHMRNHNIRAVLVAPLIAKGKPFGVIFFSYHGGPHAFTEPEMEFVRHLAVSASTAMETSRQFDDFKQAGEVLKLQAQLLRESNEELESFSYFVSHDLRAPLRAIDGYSRMILKQQENKFDEETKRQFNAIRENVKSMAQLIEDVLAFSRLGKAPLTMEKLDMGELVGGVWKEFRAAHPGRRLTLKAAPLPPCTGDRGLIRQALVNLLANAVKFTRTREEAVVEVRGEIKEGGHLYFVRDNGVGFDMQHHDKMFGVFQRLHDSGEFEGTGVGLAIVQRIINRHGGRIWAQGKVDEGATFYFTLPPPQE